METASSFRTSWDKVCQAVEYVVAWGLEHRSLGPIRAIGVDEIQYAKGHKYLTLVYQIEQDCTRLLWIGKDRTVASFEQFFDLIGKPLSEGIEFVCSDMWKPFDDWCQQAMRSRIDPMKKIAKTLRNHHELILNYFRAKKQFSTGVVDGLNLSLIHI